MTLLCAVEYNAPDDNSNGGGGLLSMELRHMIRHMTSDVYEERPSVGEVLQECLGHIRQEDSQDICQRLASVAKLDVSQDSECPI